MFHSFQCQVSFLTCLAGVTDTRPLDSALRSVNQAQTHLGNVFEELTPLERRSATATPLQLRQVAAPCHPAPVLHVIQEFRCCVFNFVPL